MEYRGYDSAGVAIVEDAGVKSCKKSGKLPNLVQELEQAEMKGTVGIGHIRWATHGEPTDQNAHPHTDCKEEIFVIHNGIIENFDELKTTLRTQGHTFSTQTDTEVLTHLIEACWNEGTLEDAVQKALKSVVGTYGLAVVSSRDPQKLVAARLGSPLVLGIIAKGEYIIASDVAAILSQTREVIYLEEGEIVAVSPEGYHIRNLDNKVINRSTDTVEWSVEQAEKQGHEDFMIKEILEQPQVVKDGLRGRLIAEDGVAHLSGFRENEEKWAKIDRIIMVACGSAAYAALAGEYMIEEYAGIPVEVEIASEFRYSKQVVSKKTAVIIVSQSGETADTIASLREAQRLRVLTYGIVNVVGSTLAREVGAGMYIHAGPEIAVASTKAFVGMLNMFALLTLSLGRQRGMSVVMGQRIARELQMLPEKITKILEQRQAIAALAKKYASLEHAFVLGRKYNYAIAREGAQKIKEVAYVHAEGYHSGELKHGPLALIDNRFYSVFIAPQDSIYEKNLSSIQELKARKGRAMVIATEGDEKMQTIADDVIYIPKTLEMLTPMLSIVPLQLFAYYTAKERGCDIDQPRNLAKSVTVE